MFQHVLMQFNCNLYFDYRPVHGLSKIVSVRSVSRKKENSTLGSAVLFFYNKRIFYIQKDNASKQNSTKKYNYYKQSTYPCEIQKMDCKYKHQRPVNFTIQAPPK